MISELKKGLEKRFNFVKFSSERRGGINVPFVYYLRLSSISTEINRVRSFEGLQNEALKAGFAIEGYAINAPFRVEKRNHIRKNFRITSIERVTLLDYNDVDNQDVVCNTKENPGIGRGVGSTVEDKLDSIGSAIQQLRAEGNTVEQHKVERLSLLSPEGTYALKCDLDDSVLETIRPLFESTWDNNADRDIPHSKEVNLNFNNRLTTFQITQYPDDTVLAMILPDAGQNIGGGVYIAKLEAVTILLITEEA